MSEKRNKTFLTEVKKVDEDTNQVTVVMSDASLDSYKEIVLPTAWKDLSRYMKHPVLLSSHDYSDLTKQIGIAKSVEVDNKGRLIGTFEYFVNQGNPEADWAFTLAKKGVAAYSVGFMANGFVTDEEEIKNLLKEHKVRVPKDEKVNAVITDADLFENSQVLVPANPNSLQLSSHKSLYKKMASAIVDTRKSDWVEELYKDLEEKVKAFNDYVTKEKRLVPYKSYPVISNDEEPWNADEATVRLREWAGFDGESVESVDFAKYAKAFTWIRDDSDSETFGAYAFPHHDIEDGNVKTHRRGTIAAMQRLPNSNFTDEEKKQIFGHLAKHYENELDLTPPEFDFLNKSEEILDNKEEELMDNETIVTEVKEVIEEKEVKKEFEVEKINISLDMNDILEFVGKRIDEKMNSLENILLKALEGHLGVIEMTVKSEVSKAIPELAEKIDDVEEVLEKVEKNLKDSKEELEVKIDETLSEKKKEDYVKSIFDQIEELNTELKQ